MAVLFVVCLLQLTAIAGRESSDLPHSTCSRIVSTPSGKSVPLIFATGVVGKFFGSSGYEIWQIDIKDNKCYANDKVFGDPCTGHSGNGYYNLTINDVTKIRELRFIGYSVICVAKFVPKCQFRSVEPDNFSENEANDQMDCTFKYERGGMETGTHFTVEEFYLTLGMSVYGTKVVCQPI
ncbi:unnamed protein product [Rodentolepis nana]|uniref:DUF5727 domain-containing protein n=1 Tax=Rodentolepis nana TaxID=102285 RepID=A0A0R3TC70_RODNA|nr:unnamed protein product [Rodentolepis nana]